MRKEIQEFSKQLREALKIAEGAKFTEQDRKFANVVISGMGGSGIGGTIAIDILKNIANVPINTNKGYRMPAYVGEDSLVIISSYSGNTEETLSAMDNARERGAKVVSITSGGQILERSKNENLNYVETPSGLMPRAALGYSLISVLQILKVFGVSREFDLAGELAGAMNLIDSKEKGIQGEARELAEFLHGKTPVLYPVSELEGGAVRLRQQLNENAKVLAWHNPLPEMHHNELLGWRDARPDLGILIVKREHEDSQMEKRIAFTKETLTKFTENILEVTILGETLFAQTIYFIHLGDWISLELAELRYVDPDEMSVIEDLKKELKK